MFAFSKSPLALFALFLAVPALFSAEKTVIVHGECPLTPDAKISPSAAMTRAYEKAQEEALQKTFGVKVQTWDMLARDDVSGSSFTSLSLQSSQGLIKKFNLLKSGWRMEKPDDIASPLNVFCDAEVTVEKIDERPDSEFFAKLEGGRLNYYDGENANFRVTASKDSFLTVFYLNGRLGGAKIFPNRAFKKNETEAGEKVTLRPITMTRETTSDDPERVWLMFVFTKKNIPFLEKPDTPVDATEINAWLAGIPADERFFILSPHSILPEDF